MEDGRPVFIYYLFAPRLGFAETMTEFEMNTMAAHFDYLQELAALGTLVLAGRPIDLSYPAVAIFEADDLEAAYHIMRNDPAVAADTLRGELSVFKLAAARAIKIV